VTSTRFTRDIRLFLASFVGFLIFIIAALLLWLNRSVRVAERAEFENHETIARVVVAELERLPESATDSILQDRLTFLTGAFAITRAELKRPAGVVAAGTAPDPAVRIDRPTRFGLLQLWFEPQATIAGWNFLVTQAILIAGTVGGTVLFFLYLPRIIRPYEQLIAQAREVGDRDESFDESHGLIDTFRRTIDTLRDQELELKRLHAIDRQRVNDLEAVTATLTRSLTSGFLAVDSGRRILDLNAAGREILGLPAEADLSGRPLEETLGRGEFASRVGDAFNERRHLNRAEVVVQRDEESVAVGLSVVPVVNSEGDFLGALALFSDLSPMRALESRVRELQTLADLGEISAGIAHEFRNSLSTVLGYLRLAERADDLETVSAKIGAARSEAEQLLEAVNRLLVFARPVRLDVKPLDLLELAHDVVDRIVAGDAQTGIEVTGETVQVEGDRALLSRAVENVVRNACESVASKGTPSTVRVSVLASPRPAIVVRDEGVGLNEEEVSRLFLPFQSDRPGGFGLGLAIARKIVLLHGGTISLSGLPGEGAEARIEFHAAE
jgi:nitrogen fixation/metabolism regulation signal transduction histidine kinase